MTTKCLERLSNLIEFEFLQTKTIAPFVICKNYTVYNRKPKLQKKTFS